MQLQKVFFPYSLFIFFLPIIRDYNVIIFYSTYFKKKYIPENLILVKKAESFWNPHKKLNIWVETENMTTSVLECDVRLSNPWRLWNCWQYLTTIWQFLMNVW